MLPTNSVAKGAKLMRGKRSGVAINARDVPASTDGGVLDDMDEMFNAAKTPSPETNASNRQKSSAAGRTRSSSNRKKAVRTNRVVPRMSLPNSRREGEDELDNDIDRKISGRSSASRYSARAKRNNFRRNGFSPSDMSSVSTAPETPRYPDENVADGDDAESPTQFDTHVDVEEQDEEMEVEEDIQRENSPARNDSSSSNENTDTESREPFPTPRAKELDHDAEEDEQVAEVAHGRTSRRHGLQAQAEDFPTDQEEGRKDESLRNHIAGDLEDTEDDDEAGDLLPPGPPEESSLEGDSTTPKTLPPGSDKVPFKSNEKSARFYDASDDDEDKEGHGYQMVGIDDEEEDSEDMNLVHDPETPKSVRRERAHRERQKIDAHARKERDRMQKKKKGSKRRRKEGDESSSSGEDDDSPVHSKKTPKTKKKTTFAVSPQGYQVDNREYETIPLSDLVEESPTDGTGVRRSRRARCRPLEYWRNEKLVYGAHNESGALGEAMGDMPVVTGVQKALKTPYKKRAVKIKKEEGHQGQTKMQAPVAKSSSRNDDEDVEFDYRKLKRKGEIMEDETARIWDDSADDAIDVSKFQRIPWISLVGPKLTSYCLFECAQRLSRTSEEWNLANYRFQNRGQKKKGRFLVWLHKLLIFPTMITTIMLDISWETLNYLQEGSRMRNQLDLALKHSPFVAANLEHWKWHTEILTSRKGS